MRGFLFLGIFALFLLLAVHAGSQEPTTVVEEKIVNLDNDQIVDGSLLINADNTKVIYLAKEDDKQYMIINGKRFKKYGWVRNPVFSPKGDRLAAIVVDEGYDYVFIDGKDIGKKFVDVLDGTLTLSNDGKGYAFVARYENAPFFSVYTDKGYSSRGVEGENIDLTFSEDGKRLAYHVAGIYEREGPKKHSIFVDGEEGTRYDDYMNGSLTFSPDGTKVAYAVKSGDKWMVVVNGEEGPKYDNIGSYTGIVFSPDSSRMAYAANIDGKWCTVVDGEPERLYDDVGKVVFSADSKHTAYWGKEDEKQRIVVDGEEGKKADLVVGVTWPPAGDEPVYMAKVGEKWFVVRGSTRGDKYENVTVDVIFSPDGGRMAYGAFKDGKWFFVIDGKETKGYEALLLQTWSFSPDGKHFVFGVIEDEKPFMVVDEAECPSRYKSFLNINGGKLIFDSDTEFHYFAAKGNDVFLVKETIGEGPAEDTE